MKLVVISRESDYTKVALKGDVHAKSVSPEEPDQLTVLLGDGWPSKKVMIDLSGVSMLSSWAIGWMLAMNRKFKAAGGKLVIHSMRPDVAKSFKILQVENVLHICPDENSAIESMKSSPT